MQGSGKLFIVPTPVGNLGDMTPRGIEVLKSASLVLAEDTRTSSTLMKQFGICTPMLSHHKFNEHESVKKIVERIKSGETIALISDAGTPAISDPGFMLSRECRNNDVEVETLPGATAFVPALVNSGLPCDRFVFEGFLPQKKGRRSRIEALSSDERTFIIYESPIRLVKTLQQLAETCGGDRQASVSREISKVHNTTVNGSLNDLIDFFIGNPPKGEIVVVVGGNAGADERKIHKNKYKPDSDKSVLI